MTKSPTPKIRFGITAKLFLVVLVAYGFLISLLVIQVQKEAQRSAQATIEKSLRDSKTILDTRLLSRFANIEETCGNVARDGLLRPFIYAGDGPTLQDQCGELAKSLDFDILIFTNAEGEILAKSDDPDAAGIFVGNSPLFQGALRGQPGRSIMRKDNTLLQIVALPVFDNAAPDVVRGAVAMAYELSPTLMAEIRSLAGSHVALYAFIPDPDKPDATITSEITNTFTADTNRLSTYFAANPELPERIRKEMAPLEASFSIAGETYDGMLRQLLSSSGKSIGFVVAVRSRNELLEPYLMIEKRAIQVGVICFILASLVSLVIAKRIAGPVIKLVGIAGDIQNGEYPETRPTKRSDEIGVLANAMHSMGRELKEKAELESYLARLSEDMDAQLTQHFTAQVNASTVADQEDVETVDDMDSHDRKKMTNEARKQAARAAAIAEIFPLGSTVSDRYRLGQTIGTGAVGVVYLAQDLELMEPVALKFINSKKLSETALNQLKQEIRLARRITHRNVLRTHDFGTANSYHYITMEFIQGYDLASLVRKLGPLELKLGILLARQICSAVAAAHAEGVIHRDLKPQNVMINRTGTLKIMDFGIAVQNEAAEGEENNAPKGFGKSAVVGTPDYMAPEQFSGEEVDERSDIYSLGVIMFFMFSGRLPYAGSSVWELAAKHAGDEIPLLGETRSDIPAALEKIVLRAMSKDRVDRPASAMEINNALAAINLD